MELSETLFFLDSKRDISFLKFLDDFDSDKRWLYSILAIDNLLISFDYQLDRKTALIEKMKSNFAKEFGINKYLRKKINDKYSSFENQIKIVLGRETSHDDTFLKNRIESEDEEITKIAKKIICACSNNSEQIDILVESYIHMMFNRIFKSRQRTYEMLIYDFVFKLYKTQQYLKNVNNTIK